jgi:hypothetical protein
MLTSICSRIEFRAALATRRWKATSALTNAAVSYQPGSRRVSSRGPRPEARGPRPENSPRGPLMVSHFGCGPLNGPSGTAERARASTEAPPTSLTEDGKRQICRQVGALHLLPYKHLYDHAMRATIA